MAIGWWQRKKIAFCPFSADYDLAQLSVLPYIYLLRRTSTLHVGFDLLCHFFLLLFKKERNDHSISPSTVTPRRARWRKQKKQRMKQNTFRTNVRIQNESGVNEKDRSPNPAGFFPPAEMQT